MSLIIFILKICKCCSNLLFNIKFPNSFILEQFELDKSSQEQPLSALAVVADSSYKQPELGQSLEFVVGSSYTTVAMVAMVVGLESGRRFHNLRNFARSLGCMMGMRWLARRFRMAQSLSLVLCIRRSFARSLGFVVGSSCRTVEMAAMAMELALAASYRMNHSLSRLSHLSHLSRNRSQSQIQIVDRIRLMILIRIVDHNRSQSQIQIVDHIHSMIQSWIVDRNRLMSQNCHSYLFLVN